MSNVPSDGEVGQQVERPVLHHRPDLGLDLPDVAGLVEILHQQLDRQAALHLELAVDAGPGLVEHLVREVGADDLDPPADQLVGHLLQHDGERIGLLAGGGGGAPDAQAALLGARRHRLRQHGVAEMVERHLVAEEERLVGGHRLGDLDGEALGARRLQLGDEIGDRRQPGLARHRQQAGSRSGTACRWRARRPERSFRNLRRYS